MTAILQIRRARPEDIGPLQALYIEAAEWLQAKGILQWRPERFTREDVEAFIAEHEVYIADLGNELAGSFSVQGNDPLIWGEHHHEDASYVHRLAVARKWKGEGIGGRMLDWAEHYTRQHGKRWLRLDCMADNTALNAYYRSMGFTYVGIFQKEGWSASLYERAVKPVAAE